LQLPLEKALVLYGEVLAKIQAHYIEETELGRLLSHGLERLDLALQNPAFVQSTFAVTPSDDALRRYREALPTRWPDLNLVSRPDAVSKVQAIAVALQQDLGGSPTGVVLEFICAAGDALDEFSAFLGPERFALEKRLSQPDIAGIGLELQPHGRFFYVASRAENGPAARAGVQLHDRILKIDGIDAHRLSLEEASLRLLGKERSRVTLDAQGVLDLIPRPIEIVRERFSLPSIGTVRMVEPETGIGYVHLGLFQSTTPEELDSALSRLAMEGLRALILDLRGNPGGAFEASVQVADRFLQDGVIASTKGRSAGTTVTFRTQDERALVLPLVLIIDAETASAAELVAGAFKDHRRATLVGQATAGKGTVQYVYPLKTVPSGLKLTAARYYSPLDRAFQSNPVQPDVIVAEDDPMELMDSMMSMMQLQQRQFEAALRTARALLMKNPM
jgi:carboxyl-terminal processing protease